MHCVCHVHVHVYVYDNLRVGEIQNDWIPQK